MISVITDCDHFSGDKVRPRLGQKLVLYKQIRTLGHLLYITFVKDHSPPTFHETFALNGPVRLVSSHHYWINKFKVLNPGSKINCIPQNNDKFFPNSIPFFQMVILGIAKYSWITLLSQNDAVSLNFVHLLNCDMEAIRSTDVCYNSALSQCCSSI